MSRNLGTLTIDLVLSLSGFKQGMDRAARETERGAKRIESSFKSLGRNVSLLRTGLGALGVGIGFREIIQATAEAEKSFALLENAVANNAGAADKTAKELAEMATQLQHVSTFSDEAIQDAQALLLTFQSIKGDNFDRATQSVLDLATRLGKDLPSAALLVGKALEDPIKGMTQLARAGVVLDAGQKRLVKSLVDTGQVAEAQAIILAELEETYQGAAAAARDNFGGALEGLKNDLGNLLEAKGGLPEATAQINAFSKALQDPKTKDAVDALITVLLKLGTTTASVLAEIGKQFVATEGSLADMGATIENVFGGEFVAADFTDVEKSIAKIEARLKELEPRLQRRIVPIEFKLEDSNLRARLASLKAEMESLPVVGAGARGFGTPAMVNAENAQLSAAQFEELDKILANSIDTSQKVQKQIDLLNKAFAAGEVEVDDYKRAHADLQAQLDKPAKKGSDPTEQARKSINDLIVSLEQQASVTGETEQATIEYRIAFGDLVDDFKKAGPAFEERKQQLIDAAAAADQFKAGEELRKANEQIAQQVIDLQAQRIALDDGAAAAFRFSAQHGELAKTLDLATDSQSEFTDAVEEGANARANLEMQTAITTIDGLIRSTEEATQAIIENTIAEEQGAVAALRYAIAQGRLKDEFEAAGPAAADLQKRLEDLTAKQEELTQRQAEDAASESIIPSRTKALKEYDDALAGLNRRLAEGEISQRDFDQAVKIAEKNFKEATKAIDEMSVFAEEAARNMQDAFAEFLFDPFGSSLEDMVNGFADTLRRMAAEVVAAKIFEKFNIADLFKTGGFGGFGGGSAGGLLAGAGAGAGLSPIAITAQRLPIPGAAAAVGEVAGESAAAAAFTAAGTAAAAALTTAGTTTAAALTTAGTTAATALGTTGTTVASAIIAAGTTAAAAIGAAATAGSAAGGLSEIVITAARLAEGGKVLGPGTAKSDSVPAMLSAGEFVVKAAAVKQPGVERLLTEINNQTVNHSTVNRYAAGGRVGERPPTTPAHEWHRTFDVHTSRTAVQDVHRLLRDERRSTVERLLQRTAAPIIVDLRQHGFAPLGDLRRSPDEFERLLARLGLLRKAEGGKVFGPGTATSDSIPAWLSAGEFVVRAAAVRKPGVQELLEKLNSSPGVFRTYATGGYVYSPHNWTKTEQHFAAGGLVQASALPTANPPATIVQQSITINAPSGQVSRATQMQVTAAAARGAKVADRRNN